MTHRSVDHEPSNNSHTKTRQEQEFEAALDWLVLAVKSERHQTGAGHLVLEIFTRDGRIIKTTTRDDRMSLPE